MTLRRIKNIFLESFCVFAFLIQFNCIFPQSSVAKPVPYNETLIGTKDGLYAVSDLSIIPLWENGQVDKILEVPSKGWYFLTVKGLLFSSDLKNFEERNSGLPINIIKKYDGTNTTLVKQVQPLKDLEIHPENSSIMVTLTKDAVFLTRDGGITWRNLGFSAKTNGAKAVAVGNMPNSDNTSSTLTVFTSHSIYGLSYIQPDISKPTWIDVTGGFEIMESMASPDEIADILVTAKNGITKVYLTQTFIPRLYELNWTTKRGEVLAKGSEILDTWDSLTTMGNNLGFLSPDGIHQYDIETKQIAPPAFQDKIISILKQISVTPTCASFPTWLTGLKKSLSLNELWLTRAHDIQSDYADAIENHKSIYVPANQVTTQAGIDKFKNIIATNKLDSLVIDMKDDYGLLRYKTNDSLVKAKGYVSSYAIDLDSFVKTFKEDNVYLIARIVVFKDKHLSQVENGKYALWDSKLNKPWLGIRSYRDVFVDEKGNELSKEQLDEIDKQNTDQRAIAKAFGWEFTEKVPTSKTVTDYYDEYWVDPYSQEVWEYNVAIAKELISLGFDEIQFDYIRFPTDGKNLSNAQYRWKDAGMDMEGALISFLSHARENIDAPIAVDIYGANGWYRSGARTGQDVETMAPYVDVICPMFYPSHFEQDFLAYTPAVERPYRVYFYGTYRNLVIARNQVLVRPWVQAFYLNVSYDRKYYGDGVDYVQRQVFGTRDAANHGYMYWNNSGRYDDIRPDIDWDTPYPWTTVETAPGLRKPALSNPVW